jgi:hypothetical protein
VTHVQETTSNEFKLQLMHLEVGIAFSLMQKIKKGNPAYCKNGCPLAQQKLRPLSLSLFFTPTEWTIDAAKKNITKNEA